MASLLERPPENPGRSARLQVASPPTCLPSSLLKPVPEKYGTLLNVILSLGAQDDVQSRVTSTVFP
ncbi:hypothetical protein Tco_1359029, partial [Tanacetum coccineum]